MRLLDRYLLRQLMLPLLIGLGVFVVILLFEAALGLGQALVGANVSALLIGKYLAYRLPRAAAWALPVGVLVGVAMTSSNISRNGEATAARVGGVSLLRLWRAFILVGILGSAASFALEEYVVPGAMQRANQVMISMTHSQPVLRPRDDQAFRDKEGRIFYVGHMDEKTNTLSNVLIFTEDAANRLRNLTAARWVELRGERWILRQGVSFDFDAQGEVMQPVQHFESREVRLWKALQDYYMDQRTPLEMTTREMREAADALESSGISAHGMRVRLQFKYSIPVGCLVFVLLAAPLGMRYARLGSFAGAVVSILVVFLYNGVRSWGLAFGLTGSLPPVIAGWAQNIVFGALGLWLTLRAR